MTAQGQTAIELSPENRGLADDLFLNISISSRPENLRSFAHNEVLHATKEPSLPSGAAMTGNGTVWPC